MRLQREKEMQKKSSSYKHNIQPLLAPKIIVVLIIIIIIIVFCLLQQC